jgi:DNA-binding CsgD family transcriptional regulator
MDSNVIGPLTPRENEVLALMVKGFQSQQIADGLGISLRTVKMHRGNIMRKAGAKNLAQLLALYYGQAKPSAA